MALRRQVTMIFFVFALAAIGPGVDARRINHKVAKGRSEVKLATSTGSKVSVSAGSRLAEAWKGDYCRMERIEMADCEARIDDEEKHCAKVAESGNAYARNNDAKCNTFKKKKDRIQDDLTKVPSRKIAGAVKACEAASLKVCEDALCPTWSAIEEKDVSQCPSVCAAASGTMFHTGSVDCEPPKTTEECFSDLQQTLKDDGRNAALEAMMREHVLKCTCVTWRDDTTQCFEGSMGIPEGKRWCDFDKTPSWQALLSKAKPGTKITQPHCDEKSTALLSMSSDVKELAQAPAPAALVSIHTDVQALGLAPAAASSEDPAAAWKKDYCRMKRIAMSDCEVRIADEEKHCSDVAQKSAYERNNDAKCNGFNKEKARIEADLSNVPTRKIAAAVKACEAASLKVCEDALCPTYSAIKKEDASKCPSVCASTGGAMFNTGSLEDGEDGVANLHKSLEKAGRKPALEALMREHVLKCTCVTWREDTTQCFEGSMGIPEGKHWCEFDNAPSWQALLAMAEPDAKITQPVCDEKATTQ